MLLSVSYYSVIQSIIILKIIPFYIPTYSYKMIEQGIYFFLFTGIFLTWIRPIFSTLTTKVTKEWLEFWIAISTLTLLELTVFPDFSREIAYHFVRTLSLFVLSERAAVAARPKAKDLYPVEENEDLPCDNFPEKIVHLEKFDEKTEVWIIEKLLMSEDKAPFEIQINVDWVSMPQSLRSCTAYKIAMLLSGDKFLDQQLENYSKSKIPALLMGLVQNKDISERDSAILAVCYLVDRCKKVRKVLFEMHTFESLRNIMQAGTKPKCIRAVVAICRKIYFEREQAKDEFIRSKMTVELISLLESEVQELVAETAEAVKDLVMKTQTILNKGYLKIMANQGLMPAVLSALEKHGSSNKLKIYLKTLETLIKTL